MKDPSKQAKVLFFDSKPYDIESFRRIENGLSFDFLEVKLNPHTASLAQGYEAVCIFVHDQACEETLRILKEGGTKLIALRCAGYNNVALKAASEQGIQVVRVPEYSPYAVAEHAAALIMTLNRKTHRAYARVRENNFSLNGLLGFDMHGKVVGIVGTGKIGQVMIRIMKGFGCEVLAFDLYPNVKFASEQDFKYVSFEEICKRSDIISLHLPLTKETRHLINSASIEKMKDGVILINTSRGSLIDTVALIQALKSQKIKAAGLDVYEEEDAYFFEDFSGDIVQDDVLARLMSFNNVIITSHQAFFTEEALSNIAQTTVYNLQEYFQQSPKLTNQVKT